MNQSDHSRGVTLVRTVMLPVSQPPPPPPHPSSTISIATVLPPRLFLFLLSFFIPSIPSLSSRQLSHTAPPTAWEEYDPHHTPRDITLLLIHTHDTLPPSSLPSPPRAPPDLLLILHSLQRCCQAVMFFLASPTQFSHSFPLPQHTAASHTPWAQLTH